MGVLTLTGTASVADYESALRSIKYRHTSDNRGGSVTVEFTGRFSSKSAGAGRWAPWTPGNAGP